MFSLLLLAIPLLIIFVFSVLITSKKEKEGGDEMFKQLYVHLVLFATLMMTIGGGIGVFMGSADLISPSSVYYERYEDYKANKLVEAQDLKQKFNEEKVRKDYERMLKDDREMTKLEAKNTIIKSFGIIIIPFPVFLYFNKMRKKNKDNE